MGWRWTSTGILKASRWWRDHPAGCTSFRRPSDVTSSASPPAGAVIMTLAIGLGVSTWQFVQKNLAFQRASAAEQEQTRLRQQAEANQKQAETEAAKSQQVAQLLKDMVIGVGPARRIGSQQRDVTGSPGSDDEARWQRSEGATRGGSGTAKHHRPHLPRSWVTFRERMRCMAKPCAAEKPFSEKPIYGWPLRSETWATHWRRLGKLEEAENTVREALAMQRKLSGNTSLDTATSLKYSGDILERQKEDVRGGGRLSGSAGSDAEDVWHGQSIHSDAPLRSRPTLYGRKAKTRRPPPFIERSWRREGGFTAKPTVLWK